MSLSINPLNQGLKLTPFPIFIGSNSVFIHQSIKPRVETKIAHHHLLKWHGSLSINPLNQGLKHHSLPSLLDFATESLSINPLNQGLKHWHGGDLGLHLIVFIHQSIKPRVETMSRLGCWLWASLSLSINPLNQGLKLKPVVIHPHPRRCLYPSIH